MALTKFTENVSNHQSLPDQPAATAQELKALFDKAPEDIKDFLNTVLIPELDDGLLDNLKLSDIINDFTTGGVNKVASAETVKNLNSQKQNKILYGSSAPTQLENGQIYIQYF